MGGHNGESNSPYLIQNAYSLCYTINAEESFRAYINQSYVTDANPTGLSASTALFYWDVILNSPFLGMLVGNLITTPITDGYGRKGKVCHRNKTAQSNGFQPRS